MSRLATLTSILDTYFTRPSDDYADTTNRTHPQLTSSSLSDQRNTNSFASLTALQVASTLQTLLSNNAHHSGSSTLESYLWSDPDALWPLLCLKCRGQEERGVDLLKAFMALPEAALGEEDVWGVPFRWKDLPWFGPHVRESFNGPFRSAPSSIGSSLSNDEIDRRYGPLLAAYRSLSTLLAHLAADTATFGSQHWETYFVWQLRDSPLETSNLNRGTEYERSAESVWDEGEFELEMAVIWLRIAGRTVKSLGEVGLGDRSLRAGELWKQEAEQTGNGDHAEKGGLCEERWAFWEQRARCLGEEGGRRGQWGREAHRIVIALRTGTEYEACDKVGEKKIEAGLPDERIGS